MLAERWTDDKTPGAGEEGASVELCNDGTGELVALFFSEQLDDIATAKAICGACPIRDACFEGALARREPYGVWGGRLFFKGKVLALKRPRGRPPKQARPLAAESA